MPPQEGLRQPSRRLLGRPGLPNVMQCKGSWRAAPPTNGPHLPLTCARWQARPALAGLGASLSVCRRRLLMCESVSCRIAICVAAVTRRPHGRAEKRKADNRQRQDEPRVSNRPHDCLHEIAIHAGNRESLTSISTRLKRSHRKEHKKCLRRQCGLEAILSATGIRRRSRHPCPFARERASVIRPDFLLRSRPARRPASSPQQQRTAGPVRSGPIRAARRGSARSRCIEWRDRERLDLQ